MRIGRYLKYQKLKKTLSKIWEKDVKNWGEEEKVTFTLVMGMEFFENSLGKAIPLYAQCDLILTSAVWATCFHKEINSIINDDEYKIKIFDLLSCVLTNYYHIEKSQLNEVLEARYRFLSRFLTADSDGKEFVEEVGYVLANDMIYEGISDFSENSALPILDIFKQTMIEKTVATYYQILIPMLVQLFKNPKGYTI